MFCNTVKKRFHNMPSSCERALCVWKAAGAGFSLLSSGSGSFGGDSLLQVVSLSCVERQTSGVSVVGRYSVKVN